MNIVTAVHTYDEERSDDPWLGAGNYYKKAHITYSHISDQDFHFTVAGDYIPQGEDNAGALRSYTFDQAGLTPVFNGVKFLSWRVTNSEAIYKKVLTMDSGDENDVSRLRVTKLISNIKISFMSRTASKKEVTLFFVSDLPVVDTTETKMSSIISSSQISKTLYEKTRGMAGENIGTPSRAILDT